MKKIYIIVFAVLLNSTLISCDPEDMAEEGIELNACCGDGEEIPPPPPPPPEG